MDHFADHAGGLSAPASDGAAVTPSDTEDLAATSRALWVGEGGDLSLVLSGGMAVTLSGVPAGTLLPVRARRIHAAGTTAGAIVALW